MSTSPRPTAADPRRILRSPRAGWPTSRSLEPKPSPGRGPTAGRSRASSPIRSATSPGSAIPSSCRCTAGRTGVFHGLRQPGAQIWAARGYAVLQGNPRGSSGRTLRVQQRQRERLGRQGLSKTSWRGGPCHRPGVADPTGWRSWAAATAGFMTFWAVTQTDRFRAAIGHAGHLRLVRLLRPDRHPQPAGVRLRRAPLGAARPMSAGPPSGTPPMSRLRSSSPTASATSGCPSPRASSTSARSRSWGRPREFLRYPRAGHGITEPRHRIHLDREQEAWFRSYLLGEAAAADSNDGG
jgi:hypothetical protein